MMKNNKLLRVFSAMLALVMLVAVMAVFSSCGNTGDGEETGSETTSGTTGDKNPGGDGDRKTQYDDLEKKAYNKSLKVISMPSCVTEFRPDEDNKGQLVTDKMIARNLRLKNDFGVTVEVEECSDYSEINDTMTKQQSGTLDDYDIYVGQLQNFKNNALQNHCVDYNEMAYVDLSGEWWDASCRDTLVMTGKNFMMTGDISPYSMLISACMAFNKDMMEDLKKTEPYALVKSNEWTLDKLYEYIDGVTNSSAQDGRGQYGMTCWEYDVPYSMFYGCGETFVKFDNETGDPTVSFNNAKAIDIYDKIFKTIVTAESLFCTLTDDMMGEENPDAEAYETFADGRSLFVDITLSKISKFITSMEDDYGVVPMPKYDVAQNDYLTFVNGAAPMFMVATTEKDVSFVGHMLEAMATYNYQEVTDDLYETVCKSTDLRDPDSADMVDIILRSRVYDFAYYAQLPVADVVYGNLAAGRDSVATAFKAASTSSKNMLTMMIRDWNKIQSQIKK